MDDETAIVCPNCKKSDKTAKISELVKESSKTFEEAQLPNLTIIEWGGQEYSLPIRENRIPAIKLLPWIVVKGKPKAITIDISNHDKNIVIYFLSGIVLVSLMGFFGGLAVNNTLILIFGGIGLVITGLVLGSILIVGGIIKAANKVSKLDLATYNEAIEKVNLAQSKWEKLFYCYRCDLVFTREGFNLTPREMQKYLFLDETNN